MNLIFKKTRDESDDMATTVEDIIRIIGTKINEKYTVDIDPNLITYIDPDAEKELSQILADEIQKEIDKEIIEMLTPNTPIASAINVYQPNVIQRPKDGWHQSPLGIWIP